MIKNRRIVDELNSNGEVKTKDLYEIDKHSNLLKKGYSLIYIDLLNVYAVLKGSEPFLLSYILKHINKQNMLKISYKELSNKTKLSIDRIKQIMKKLKDLNVLRNVGGVIYINPYMYSKAKNNTGQLQLDYMPIFKIKEI